MLQHLSGQQPLLFPALMMLLNLAMKGLQEKKQASEHQEFNTSIILYSFLWSELKRNEIFYSLTCL